MIHTSDFLAQIVYKSGGLIMNDVVATDFASNLKANLEAEPKLRFRGRRLLAFLNTPDSPEKQAKLVNMEHHAKIHLGMAHQTMVAIDWSQIDWPSILFGLLKFLLTILPLFL
jgi:hypothetical protein